MEWLPPDQVNQHGVITHYTIVITDKTFNVSGATVSVPADTQYSFTNLQEHAQYYYQIAAATSAGQGPFSEPQNFTTFEDSKQLTLTVSFYCSLHCYVNCHNTYMLSLLVPVQLPLLLLSLCMVCSTLPLPSASPGHLHHHSMSMVSSSTTLLE